MQNRTARVNPLFNHFENLKRCSSWEVHTADAGKN